MKLRVIGTKEECETAKRYYSSLSGPAVKYVSVSKLYPSRYSKKQFRIYIEIEYFTATEKSEGQSSPKELDLRTIHNAHLSAKGWQT